MSLQAVRGTKDILPSEIAQWHAVEAIFRDVAREFAYEEIRTPIFESTELFKRGVGEETDIVGKEMYTFADRGGDSLTLRPEMTAPVVRALVEHSLLRHQPVMRLWYAGPQFRYDRPQKGRYRQFHQFGAECVGSPNPESDAEIILVACETLRRCGCSAFTLEINTLGTSSVRQTYRETLVAYLREHHALLSADSQRRMETNPLRVLDSKDERDVAIVAGAPSILDVLDADSRSHFEAVLALLDVAGVPYKINSTLVRGLDYYNHTVFEFTTTALGSQNAIGGGGRYDPLFAMLGGGDVPAVGFSIGIERMLMLREHEHVVPAESERDGVYLCAIGAEAILPAHVLALRLRRQGLRVVTDVMRRSMKGQLKEANRHNVKYAVMLGENELVEGTVVVKDLQSTEQQTIRQTELETLLLAL